MQKGLAVAGVITVIGGAYMYQQKRAKTDAKNDKIDKKKPVLPNTGDDDTAVVPPAPLPLVTSVREPPAKLNGHQTNHEVGLLHDKRMTLDKLQAKAAEYADIMNVAAQYILTIDISNLDDTNKERYNGWKTYMHDRKRVVAGLYRWICKKYPDDIPVWTGPDIGPLVATTAKDMARKLREKGPEYNARIAQYAGQVERARKGWPVHPVEPPFSWLQIPKSRGDAVFAKFILTHAMALNAQA